MKLIRLRLFAGFEMISILFGLSLAGIPRVIAKVFFTVSSQSVGIIEFNISELISILESIQVGEKRRFS